MVIENPTWHLPDPGNVEGEINALTKLLIGFSAPFAEVDGRRFIDAGDDVRRIDVGQDKRRIDSNQDKRRVSKQ